MKKVFVLFLFSLAACGLQPKEPVAGIYDITLTPTSMTPSSSSVYCPALDNPTKLIIELVKENGEWSLYGCNSDCSQKLLLAISSDGNTFNPRGCSGPWCENIVFNLTCNTHSGETTINGDAIITLTMPQYAPSSCTETETVEGTKR